MASRRMDEYKANWCQGATVRTPKRRQVIQIDYSDLYPSVIRECTEEELAARKAKKLIAAKVAANSMYPVVWPSS